MSDSDLSVSLPARDTGQVLTVAGLAGWVLAEAGDDDAAGQTCTIQDWVDGALAIGLDRDVSLPVEVVTEAVALWRRAADLLDAKAASLRPGAPRPKEDADAAHRLRRNADKLARLVS